jgi:D-threo-aldose 1-dehydrogenase
MMPARSRPMTDSEVIIDRVPVRDTGLEISRLIFGCSSIGGLFTACDPEIAAGGLAASWDVGIRTFDTAPHYGVGLAEERLGSFLATKPRSEFVVSTKVGRLLVATDADVEGVDGFFGTPQRTRVRDYSGDGVRRSIEDSCERLGLDQIDIALIHDPDDYWEAAIGEAIPALVQLRSEGIVKAIGVGINIADMATRFVEESDIDCVLIAGCYSLIEESATETLFPACTQAGVAVIAAGIYESGILANPKAGANFRYATAPDELVARVAKIAGICARYDVPLPAAALQYVLANPAVTAATIGARADARVRQNAEFFNAAVPRELFDELTAEGLVAPIAGS